mmetsp:Transcript_32400/g.90705  ORF Transcript_32400/g.90705 Transcript_32400/m.90705 type:complete len:395 (+) Transcript_32400:98-1282(+)|eukprot:CAMPEP_0119121440 /NCGR_PEP_ID=MMETSP1310-20130426/2071_1 /TAXON_ID=464262 /ORGANISM="Genus nov. species nov., Strain RCC2339" /LENGTH=394 /DNA_ID=CAMNT_0007111003 /DNA_START=98 /DNA_END=1282 /DNA_ORIENTATION=+
MALKSAVIVSAVRTPLGSFGGSLAGMTAPQLGSVAIRAALERAGVAGGDVDECFMGNVLQAGQGQAPARQAALGAGLSNKVPCTTVNKVCASGMKAAMFAAQSVMLGHQKCIVAGGFESMSNVPYYLPKQRQGLRMGHGEVVDGLIYDGLWDPYDNHHMGNAGEHCARTRSISREDQDEFAVSSYHRASEAHAKGYFKDEIVPVSIPQRRGDPKVVSADEEVDKFNESKFRALRPAFQKDGTITAGNASKINDGAAALVVMAEDEALARGLNPVARIVSFADAAMAPIDFTIAPASAVQRALARANLSVKDISFWETNEAFSVVALANSQILGISNDIVNVHGGAVALGHPIGCSGARIITTLINVLRTHGGQYGVASICNGGGGASAIVIEKM